MQRKSQFIKKEHVGKDTWSFLFSYPEDFHFFAGQYVQLTLPIASPDEKGVDRFFSLSSSPEEAYITITTKIAQDEMQRSSFKRTLFALAPGEIVVLFGPMGTFVLT